jgi:hypothetical protein
VPRPKRGGVHAGFDWSMPAQTQPDPPTVSSPSPSRYRTAAASRSRPAPALPPCSSRCRLSAETSCAFDQAAPGHWMLAATHLEHAAGELLPSVALASSAAPGASVLAGFQPMTSPTTQPHRACPNPAPNNPTNPTVGSLTCGGVPLLFCCTLRPLLPFLWDAQPQLEAPGQNRTGHGLH